MDPREIRKSAGIGHLTPIGALENFPFICILPFDLIHVELLLRAIPVCNLSFALLDFLRSPSLRKKTVLKTMFKI